MRARGALRELPLEAEQVFQVVVVPLRWVGGPGALQSAGPRVGAVAAANAILPAEALFFDAGALGFGTDILARIDRAMGFAERVSAGDEGYRLLVIHRHAAERLPDMPYCSDWIGLSIGPLRIHVN